MCVEEKCAYDGLDTEDSCGAQRGTVIADNSVLNVGTVHIGACLYG